MAWPFTRVIHLMVHEDFTRASLFLSVELPQSALCTSHLLFPLTVNSGATLGVDRFFCHLTAELCHELLVKHRVIEHAKLLLQLVVRWIRPIFVLEE